MADNKIKIPFPPIDEARKEASLQKIHREISHKSLPVPVSFPELLLDQMHYISLEYWVIQAFFLLAVILFTTCFGTLIKDSESILPSPVPSLPAWGWPLFWSFPKAAPGIWQSWNKAAASILDRFGR